MRFGICEVIPCIWLHVICRMQNVAYQCNGYKLLHRASLFRHSTQHKLINLSVVRQQCIRYLWSTYLVSFASYLFFSFLSLSLSLQFLSIFFSTKLLVESYITNLILTIQLKAEEWPGLGTRKREVQLKSKRSLLYLRIQSVI